MLEFGACPRCKNEISAERKRQTPVVCNHCGHVASSNYERLTNEREKHTMTTFGVIGIIAVACFIQLSNWDSHFFEVIPLKIKETVGVSAPSDIDRMAEICMDLKKWDCVESNYARAGEFDSRQLPRLGQFQMKRAKYNEAAQSFYKFFQKGGNDLEASYSYAKALAQLGQVDDAVKYFDQVLAARPDVLQVTVVTNYVKLLMDHQRYEQAAKLIQEIRGKGPETAMFMEIEFKKIKSMTTASRE